MNAGERERLNFCQVKCVHFIVSTVVAAAAANSTSNSDDSGLLGEATNGKNGVKEENDVEVGHKWVKAGVGKLKQF